MCGDVLGYCGYTHLLQPLLCGVDGCNSRGEVGGQGCNRSNFAGNWLVPRLTRHVTDVTAVTDFWSAWGAVSRRSAGLARRVRDPIGCVGVVTCHAKMTMWREPELERWPQRSRLPLCLPVLR